MPPPFDGMTTRRKRLDYRLLNDGSDEEALPQDRVASPTPEIGTFFDGSNSEIVPSESASQYQLPHTSSIMADSSIASHILQDTYPRSCQRLTSASEWLWAYFETTEIDREWVLKKSRKRKLADREIQCTFVAEKTGKQCGWRTTDSARQSSTGNMRLHLSKHSIYSPDTASPEASKKPKSTILNLLGAKEKENLTHQQLLEKNILRWIVTEKQAFTTIESPDFQQIFHDIPGISLPFTSRHTVRQRLIENFNVQRLQLKEELSITCKTIALSLDIWTSKNHLPILGIIGHWLTEDFEYQEKVLEFTELCGTHSGENLAAAVETLLEELGLEHKLITITGDNASNNETMVSELFHNLQENLNSAPLFQGLDSYVRCLAHILNLIVKDIFRALKSGNTEEAHTACDCLRDGIPWPSATQGALAKLRIFALWIDRSPQRRKKWTDICQIANLPGKFIEYDVDTRWNSTFRMLSDGLHAKCQINKFLEWQKDFPPFTTKDWNRLAQIYDVLLKFNEFTLFVSKKKPQISLTVPIYYELHDLLNEASERKGRFSGLDEDIALAIKEGMKKYKKYYTFMDESDTYYTALTLDPRVKGDLILEELQDDENSGSLILKAIRDNLHQTYRLNDTESGLLTTVPTLRESDSEYSDIESRMLQRLQPRNQSLLSDIDRYFDSPLVSVTDTKDPNWLCDWWRIHKDEYPQMAKAARDYLAIPASEVAVERLFSAGRDLLGIRRHSMKADTMRMLMLMNDVYRQ